MAANAIFMDIIQGAFSFSIFIKYVGVCNECKH